MQADAVASEAGDAVASEAGDAVASEAGDAVASEAGASGSRGGSASQRTQEACKSRSGALNSPPAQTSIARLPRRQRRRDSSLRPGMASSTAEREWAASSMGNRGV